MRKEHQDLAAGGSFFGLLLSSLSQPAQVQQQARMESRPSVESCQAADAEVDR